MLHNDPVVVGVARSGSDAAVRFAATEALRAGRPLELVHVTPGVDGWAGQLGQDALRLAVRRARSVAGDGLDVRYETETGDTLTELTNLSSRAELLVLERRRPVVQRRRLNSFTEQVAGAVDVPMVSVPTEWTSNTYGVITVGLDLRHPDQRAVRTAIRLARLRRAVLRVAVTTFPELAQPRQYAEALLAELGPDACDMALEVTSGDLDSTLISLARRSDLLVLGRHRPVTPTDTRLGAVSRSVLRESVSPVWLTAPGHVHTAAMVGEEELTDSEAPRHSARRVPPTGHNAEVPPRHLAMTAPQRAPTSGLLQIRRAPWPSTRRTRPA